MPSARTSLLRCGAAATALAAVAVLALLVAGGVGRSQAQARSGDPERDAAYAVACEENATQAEACTVDRLTYVGWRVFHRTCAVCHSSDALGSGFAPNLVRRVRQMNGAEFRGAMDTGYAGDGEMQPWGLNPEVRPFYVELWAYLAARANGDLPPGEPRPMPATGSGSAAAAGGR